MLSAMNTPVSNNTDPAQPDTAGQEARKMSEAPAVKDPVLKVCPPRPDLEDFVLDEVRSNRKTACLPDGTTLLLKEIQPQAHEYYQLQLVDNQSRIYHASQQGMREGPDGKPQPFLCMRSAPPATVNGLPVTAPLRQAPQVGESYWVMHGEIPLQSIWQDSALDYARLEAGYAFGSDTTALAWRNASLRGSRPLQVQLLLVGDTLLLASDAELKVKFAWCNRQPLPDAPAAPAEKTGDKNPPQEKQPVEKPAAPPLHILRFTNACLAIEGDAFPVLLERALHGWEETQTQPAWLIPVASCEQLQQATPVNGQQQKEHEQEAQTEQKEQAEQKVQENQKEPPAASQTPPAQEQPPAETQNHQDSDIPFDEDDDPQTRLPPPSDDPDGAGQPDPDTEQFLKRAALQQAGETARVQDYHHGDDPRYGNGPKNILWDNGTEYPQ